MRRGHRVVVIAQTVAGRDATEQVDGIRIHRVGPAIRQKYVLTPSPRDNLLYLSKAALRAVSVVREEGTHVIHSNTYTPALVGQFDSSLTGTPHIVTIHDVYSLMGPSFWKRWLAQTSAGRGMWIIAKTLEMLVTRLPFARMHTVSEASMGDLRRFGVKGPITVIPNGLEMSDYAPRSSSTDGRPFGLYLGRIAFHKNLATVLYAVMRVVDRHPRFRLVIAGDGPLRSEFMALAARLEISGNVLFTGVVNHRDKVRLLSDCSFLVLPSVFEGFSIVLLEAFACGKPVICCDLRPMSDIVVDGKEGLLVKPFDPGAWAGAMLSLMEDRRSAVEMGSCGHDKLLRSFTIQRVCDQLEKLYGSVSVTSRVLPEVGL